MPFPKIKWTAVTPQGNSNATLDELAEELDCDIQRAPTHLTTFVSGRKKTKSNEVKRSHK